MTVSHLRFGPRPIRSMLIGVADVACHRFSLLERTDVLEIAAQGAVFLLNSPYHGDDVWDHLPVAVRATLIRKAIRLYVIDADRLAAQAGLDAASIRSCKRASLR